MKLPVASSILILIAALVAASFMIGCSHQRGASEILTEPVGGAPAEARPDPSIADRERGARTASEADEPDGGVERDRLRHEDREVLPRRGLQQPLAQQVPDLQGRRHRPRLPSLQPMQSVGGIQDGQREFKALRSEIVSLIQTGTQTWLSTTIATAAVLAFAKGQQVSWYCLVPLVVIIPNGFFWAAKSEDIQRIASYIQVFGGEVDGKYLWEKLLNASAPKFRTWHCASTLSRFRDTSAFLGLGLLSVVLFLVGSTPKWHHWSAAAAVILLLAAMQYRIVIVPRLRPVYLAQWRKLAHSAPDSESRE